ncbi:hypothetical protein [Shewanella halifaxensis]|uniref:hypothetical protein n=1 Tax=Shewanella halifaxensis TaxID=271098 RepID=UPI000D59BC8E|nr:hypothetical protein [Shewanella halifaxensis]
MRKGTVILLVLLITSNLLWLVNLVYTRIDHAVTLTYHDASYQRNQRMLQKLVVVANNNLVGDTLTRAEGILAEQSNATKPFIKEACLIAGGLCLKFDQNELIVAVIIEP